MNLGYVRISTQKQSLNTSLENQRNKINDYCKLNDYNLLKFCLTQGSFFNKHNVFTRNKSTK